MGIELLLLIVILILGAIFLLSFTVLSGWIQGRRDRRGSTLRADEEDQKSHRITG